jgi:hypothetical protein
MGLMQVMTSSLIVAYCMFDLGWAIGTSVTAGALSARIHSFVHKLADQHITRRGASSRRCRTVPAPLQTRFNHPEFPGSKSLCAILLRG